MLINNHNRIFAAIVALLALTYLSTGIPAQQNDTKPSPAAAQKQATDNVIGKADYMKTGWGSKKTTLLKGNVKFTHGDTILTSDQIDYDEAIKTAISPGKVKITNPECDISGDKGMAYFNKKLGVVEGSVSMLIKPQNTEEQKTDKDSVNFKKPTTITCNKLEYLYKTKIATATGNIIFKQEKRTATADKAVYDQKKEILTLTGNVKGVDDQGQTFSAPGTVTISLKQGDEWMEASDASATFKIDLDDEEEATQ